MKAFIISAFLSVAVLNICTAGVFNDKEKAISEINAKFLEVNKTRSSILQSLVNEKNNIQNSGEVDMLKHLETKTKELRAHLDKEVTSVIRTAIVRAKPISVIHCIRNTASNASTHITELHYKMFEKITQIREDKVRKIDLDEYSVNAISTGVRELLDDAITKIRNGYDIQAVKKEAFGNCESAMILLGDIEIHVHEPILSIQYIKMRQEIERKYKEFKVQLENQFNNCLKGPLN